MSDNLASGQKLKRTYKMPNGALYVVRYECVRRAIRIKVLSHPPCPYQLGVSAHLLEGSYICIAEGREPETLDHAKAIAMHWMHGFEAYRRSGQFPNGPARVHVN